MHRETLSRGFLFSHNLIGKSVIPLNWNRIIDGGARNSSLTMTVFNRPPETLLSSRRYFHSSMKRNAHSFSRTSIAEAKRNSGESEETSSTSAEGQQSSRKYPAPPQYQQKTFNISAKDILCSHDGDHGSPSPLTSTSTQTKIPYDPDQPSSTVINRIMLDTKIYSARSVEQLLNLSTEHGLTLKHACMIISRLGNFHHLRKEKDDFSQQLQTDNRFVRIFNLVQRGNHSQFPHSLLQALTGLQKLGVETSEQVSKRVEKELCWSMGRCPLRFLAKSVKILNDNMISKKIVVSEQTDHALLPAAIKVLKRRWIEAVPGSDFISLFQIIELFDDEIKHAHALISSLMISLGQMRYKNKEILVAVDDWIMKNLPNLRPFDCAAWLQVAATLNHESENMEKFCNKAEQVLNQSSVPNPIEWVNIVHSFVLINHCKTELLASVLNPSFVETIENLGVKTARHKLKLLNINFIAMQSKEYKGTLLPNNKVTDWTTSLVMSSDDKLSKLVVDSLGSFLTPAKYLELSKQLECGVFVDAVCYMDTKSMSPSPALESINTKSSSIFKVAMVVESYSMMCLGLKQPTGQSLFNVRMLEAQGYVVATVPYTEFGPSEKIIRRVQYLEQKLKTVSQRNEEALSVSASSRL